jgi:Resolvase, N terminal domain
MKRAAIYLRVSTIDQTTANQERELRQVAERAGWDVVKVYKDHGISGAKGREKRPQFDALHRDANARQFDVVMAWSVDRLGRSLQDLVEFLTNLHALKIDLFLKTQGIDTTTPAGKALFQMMGVFAEFERAMIQERGTFLLLFWRRLVAKQIAFAKPSPCQAAPLWPAQVSLAAEAQWLAVPLEAKSEERSGRQGIPGRHGAPGGCPD